jgi:ubiquinone biosynthesis protein Coq4
MKNPFKLLGAATAFLKITRDTNRLNEVFSLSDATVDREVLARVREHYLALPGGRERLAARKRLPRYSLAELRQLPEGTLGRVFADHMISNRLDPDAIPMKPANDELEFINAHLYETHDIWHVATGFATDVAGELGLQAFYLAQFPGILPTAILAAGLLNTGFYRMDTREARMDALTRGWQLGREAGMLFGVDWAALWATPLAEVRKQLNLPLEGANCRLEPRAVGMAAQLVAPI